MIIIFLFVKKLTLEIQGFKNKINYHTNSVIYAYRVTCDSGIIVVIIINQPTEQLSEF